jgi:ubiquinone/menaquinone biosynthesis C-methylase UbiE
MSDPTAPGAHDGLGEDVTADGVFRAVLEGYDAVYDALPRGQTFSRLWRLHAYGGDFPEQFAHIGFLTAAEAQRLRELLRIRPGEALADLACGAGGPGLWMASKSGAFLTGVDPSPAGLAAARQRAPDAGRAGRARFQRGTFEHTNLAGGAACAVMSIDAFQYAPGKAAALAELARIMRPGARAGIVCFEVDPAKVAGLPVLGVDPVADYRPLMTTAGLTVEAYEETPGWQQRVHAAFSAIAENTDTLIAEMGELAAASAVAEAMITLQIKPYPRRIMAVASRPG